MPERSPKWSRILSAWSRLTSARSTDPDQAIQEYLTKVILVLMEIVLIPVGLLLLVGWLLGVFPVHIIIAVLAAVMSAASWVGADRGYWRIVRYMPVVLFFLLGVFSTFSSGFVSILMGYLLAIVLASFLLGNREQWIVVGLSLATHLGLGWWKYREPLDDMLMYAVTIASMFSGIALLLWLASAQLHRALDKARAFAGSLQSENAERRRVEQALKISEEKYRMLVENQGEGVVFVDPDETFTFANPACETIFGLPPGRLLGRNLCEFTTPEEFARIREQTEMRRSGEKSNYELEITRTDGERRILLVTATPLFKNGGDFTGAFGVLRDITHRKQEEAELARYAQGMAALYDTSLEIDAQIELPTLLKAIVQRAAGLVGTSMASLYMLSTAGNALEMVINQPQGGDHFTLRLGEGLAGRVAQTGEPFFVEDHFQWEGRLDPINHLSKGDVGRALGVPLKVSGKVIGVLTVQDFHSGAFDEEEIKLVCLFADQAALAIEKARLYAEVQRLATVDEVTGLLNRRGLWEFGRREFERARRFNRPLAAIFLDIDFFKLVNDTYGHATGDQVLHILGERLKTNTREVDVIARYGGEEFIILLPEVDTATALQIAERLRRSACDAPFVTDQGPIASSLSLGVVQITEEIHDLATLIDLADQAMFAAKQRGRNRVEIGVA